MNETFNGVALIPVTSSQIEAIGHDGKTTLFIKFKNGSIYSYQNFSLRHFLTFKEAESIGSYFYRHIKPAPETYPYKKETP